MVTYRRMHSGHSRTLWPQSCPQTWSMKRAFSTTALLAALIACGASTSAGAVSISADQNSVTLSAAPGNTSPPVQVNISTSSTSPINFTVSQSPKYGSWLTVYADDGTSVSSAGPTALYIVGDATNYSSPTTLNGTVTITAANSPSIQINVTFNIGTSGPSNPSATLVPSQSNVTFNYPPGTNGSGSVQVTVNAASGASTTAFSATAATQSGGQWLVLVCTGSCSNQPIGSQLTLKVDPTVAATLSAGTYQGSVTLTNTASSSDQTTVGVTLSVNQGSGGVTGTLIPSQSSVSLSYASGACGTTATEVSVSAASGSSTTAFAAVATTQTGGQWLVLSCQNSCSNQPVGSQLTINVDSSVAATLQTGVYQGTITLTNTTSSSDRTIINVSLAVNTAISTGTTSANLAAPASLMYAYPTAANGAFPFQTIVIAGDNPTVVQSSNGSFPCGARLNYALSGNTVLVSLSGTGFQAGTTYSGSITVGSSTGTQTVPVVVVASAGPTLVPFPGTITCQPSQAACSNSSLILAMSDNSNRSLSLTSTASWVTISPAGCGATTPASCTINVNTGGLPSGLNTATITATALGAANSPVSIPVVVLTPGDLSLSNNSLTFTTSVPAQQSLTVSAAGGANFGVTYGVNTPAGGAWLSAVASSSTTPATVTVSVDPTGLGPGQYTGFVTLTAGGLPQLVTVTLTVPSSAAGGVIVSSGSPLTSLSFSVQAGGSAPPDQQVLISGAPGSPNVTFSYSTSASWLLVNKKRTGQATTPADFSVSVDPSVLVTAGVQSAAIVLTPTGGQAVTISVSVTVSAPFSLLATPVNMSFTYTVGALPPSGQIQVSGNGGTLSFTATAVSTGNWLAVTPAAGTTAPGGTVPLTISLQNLNSLAPSTTPYSGTIQVAGSAGSTTVSVSLTVLPPLPTVVKVTNGASFLSGPISPGEMVTIFGQGLGPDIGVPVTPTLIVNSRLPFTLGGVQVLVGGFPAPLLYASSSQISAVVPYEITSSGQNLILQVKYLGQGSNAFALTQAAAAPGILTANLSGTGPGAILNANGTANFWGNPANQGDPVVLYVTGEGQTTPPGVSGSITPATPPFPQSLQAPTVTIGGLPAAVLLYAEAPGMVSGVMQINVQIPAAAPSGALPVVVSFGSATSQLAPDGTGAVTVSVR